MRRLRIFVPSSSEYLTDRDGWGEGLIAWHLLVELAARGHELVVLARDAALSTKPPFELVVTGVASRYESVEPLAYMRLARSICEARGGAERFDLAHWLLPAGSRYLLFTPPPGLPLVTGPQFEQWPRGTFTRRRAPGDLVRDVARPLFARARARTVAAAAVVMGATEGALAGVPAAKALVVPCGVDVARFPPAPPTDAQRVLFVGRVEDGKGVRELLECFPHVRKRVPAAELHVVGEGSLTGWLRARADELGLNGSVVVRGALPHERVAAELRDAALLCLPSYREPFGMVVLEAMASARAVVATDEGGPRVLVDPSRGGRLVPAGDIGALGDALSELLLNGNALAEMGRFNRRRVEEEFTIAHFADRVERAYAKAVGDA